jgi:hypothetical protein
MLNRQTAQSIFEQQRDRSLSTFEKCFSGCYLVVGLGALLLTLFFWLRYTAPNALLSFIGLAYLGLWFWFRRDIANDRVCARMMLEALKDGGKQLAWVYRENELTLQGSCQAIRFHFLFTNKRHGTLAAKEKLVAELLDYFALNFPQVSNGYKPELEKRFRRSPEDLKINPVCSRAILVQTVDHSQSNGW